MLLISPKILWLFCIPLMFVCIGCSSFLSDSVECRFENYLQNDMDIDEVTAALDSEGVFAIVLHDRDSLCQFIFVKNTLQIGETPNKTWLIAQRRYPTQDKGGVFFVWSQGSLDFRTGMNYSFDYLAEFVSTTWYGMRIQNEVLNNVVARCFGSELNVVAYSAAEFSKLKIVSEDDAVFTYFKLWSAANNY